MSGAGKLAATLALGLTMAGAASAATLTASWDPNSTTPVPGGFGLLADFNSGVAFTIEFNDVDGDDLFDFSTTEFVSFSGVTIKSFASDPGVTRDTLVLAPRIDGVTEVPPISTDTLWIFGTSGSQTTTVLDRDTFTYGVTGLPTAPIPLPAAAWLLLGGLGALGALARRPATV